jgi:hypothetical protein
MRCEGRIRRTERVGEAGNDAVLDRAPGVSGDVDGAIWRERDRSPELETAEVGMCSAAAPERRVQRPIGAEARDEQVAASPHRGGVAADEDLAVGLKHDAVAGLVLPTGGTKKDLLAIRLQGDSSSTPTGGSSGGTSNGSSPSGGSTGGGAGPSATTRALASTLALSSSTFAAQTSGPSASATGTHGTSVRFQLNVVAEMSFGIERVTVGRKLTRKGTSVCAAQMSSNHSKPRCTRLVSLRGAFARAGVAGTNSFHFSGRLSGRALAPGHYRLLGTPIVNGARAATVSIAFTIIG